MKDDSGMGLNFLKSQYNYRKILYYSKKLSEINNISKFLKYHRVFRKYFRRKHRNYNSDC